MSSEDATARARRLLEQITPGEWVAHPAGVENGAWQEPYVVTKSPTVHRYIATCRGWKDSSDVEFIAAAPQLVRDLVAALEAAESARGQLQAEHEQFRARLENIAEFSCECQAGYESEGACICLFTVNGLARITLRQAQATTERDEAHGGASGLVPNDQSREEPTNVGALPSPPEARPDTLRGDGDR